MLAAQKGGKMWASAILGIEATIQIISSTER